MGIEESQKPEQLSRNVIYESPWVNLYEDRVRFPGGRIVEKHTVLDFEMEAVGVIAENENREIILVQAYRYITDTIDWEIPAGAIDAGETVMEAGGREVLEETGFEIEDMELVYTYYPMMGLSNKVFHIVTGRATECVGEFDRNEVKSVHWFSRDEIRDMIKQNQIKDGLSLTALLLYFQEI